MSLGIFALKVGLVTTVAGTAVVTPILLRNKRALVTEFVKSAETLRTNELGSSESSVSEREDLRAESDSRGLTGTEETQRVSDSDSGFLASTSESSSSSHGSTGEEVSQRVSGDLNRFDSEQTANDAESEETRTDLPENTKDLSRSGSPVSPQESVTHEISPSSPVVKKEEFGKKCFVVPAKSNNGENVQLLTCYDEHKLREEVDEDQPEYKSEFHIYDPSKPKNPIEIKGSLQWTPTDKQLVAKLESNSYTTYTFTATGNHWRGISPSNKPVNLMNTNECAIYEAKLNDSTDSSTHLLTCGGDSEDFTWEEPKGIPLTNWELKRQ